MIRVGVVGAGGRMGQEVVAPCKGRPTWRWSAAIDPAHVGNDAAGLTIVGEVNALGDLGAEVVVDFTIAEAVRHNVTHYAKQGIHAVIGTSGLGDDDVTHIGEAFDGSGANVVVAANFAIGAVLLMHCARDRGAPHGRRRGDRAAPRRQARCAFGDLAADGRADRRGPARGGECAARPGPDDGLRVAGAPAVQRRRAASTCTRSACPGSWRTRRSSSAQRARA